MSIKEDLCSVGHEEGDDFMGLMDSQREVETGKEQLQQMLTVSESLESLIKHLDSVQTVTLEHAESIRISCENLLRGTGYEYSILVPALEGYSEGTVSTESLKDKLHSVWKRIVQIILSILAGMKRYWSKVASYEGRLRMTAEALRKQGAIQRNSSKKDQVDLGIEVKSLLVGSSLIKDADTLIRAISSATEQYRIVTNIYPKGMVAVGNTYEALFKKGDANVRQTLEEFCVASSALPFANIATSLRAMTYRDTRFGPRQILMAPPVLGGWSLFINVADTPITGLTGNDLTTQAARMRSSGLKFALTDVNANNNLTSATIRTASGGQVEQMAMKVIGILDVIKAQEANRQINKISNQIKAVLSAAEGYKGQSHVGGDGTAVYSESILRFARSYSSWAVGPVDQMTTNLLTVSRAILIYGRKSLQN